MFMLKEFHVGKLERDEGRMNAGIHTEFTLRGVLTVQLMSSAYV
jgi:hypothetical protein